MIHHVVQFALRQRLLVLLVVAFIAVGGAISFQHMPVDAYPDLSPPMVEVITQWPGHAAEEIERLVTLPTEVEMNGVPKMAIQRSISLYGLSDVILTFDEDTDDYFARQIVFQRLSEVNFPTGVQPTLAPLSSPSGLVYRYVLESPDRSPQELKTFEDWVIEREFKSWFSFGRWRGLDKGVSFQRDLYTNIWCLKLGVQLWLSHRSSTEVQRADARHLDATISGEPPKKRGILEALRRSPLVGADLELKRSEESSRKAGL